MMHLKSLKKMKPAELVEMAEELGVEGASTLRKQDLMFAILKVEAENGEEIIGEHHALETQLIAQDAANPTRRGACRQIHSRPDAAEMACAGGADSKAASAHAWPF